MEKREEKNKGKGELDDEKKDVQLTCMGLADLIGLSSPPPSEMPGDGRG